MKDIVIIGAGGIGREVAWIIEEINEVNPTWNVIGFVDENIEMHNKVLNEYKVLGNLEALDKLEIKPYVVVAIANCSVKKDIVTRLENKFNFATIVYPSVRVSKYVEVGQGSIIYPGVILTVNTKIGNHVIISGNCGIGHDTVIGDYSSILWGSCFSGYDIIGENSFIGVGTNIIQGINMGSGIIVQAGTVVMKDILDNNLRK